MLAPVSLADLELTGVAAREGQNVSFDIQESWCAPGENRVGYPTISRLVECVREHHWKIDVDSLGHAGIDSITRSFSMDFARPIYAGRGVMGVYDIRWVRQHSYGMSIYLADVDLVNPLVIADFAFTFWDPASESVVEPPSDLYLRLRSRVEDREPFNLRGRV